MTNYELAMMVTCTSDEWITKKTGIRERRIAAPEEAPSGMAARRRALSGAGGGGRAAVDLVIVACATPDQSQPAVACMVQEKLGSPSVNVRRST
jgi:3-oxoacyl-[acyl-carrier-protein] synthase-3